MSLNGALQIGRSAIAVSQAGIAVAGQNMANAATVGYSRQVAHLAASPGNNVGRGQSIGTGVQLLQVARQVDTAVQARLRDAISSENGALIAQRFLTALESIQNELSTNDLSTMLSDFFNSFSELANNPQQEAVRSVVIEQAVSLGDRINQMRTEYAQLQDEIDRDLGVSVDRINSLLDDLEIVNAQIAHAEQGAGTANALRDRRDQIVSELSQYMDLSAIEQPNGSVDVLVGSIPLMLAGQSRGVVLRTESINGQIEVSVRVAADQTPLEIESGRLGELLRQREETINPAIEAIDTFAAQLIWQVNRLHSQGQGQVGFTDITGTNHARDTTAPMNGVAAELPFAMTKGSFSLHVTQLETGARTTFEIQVDPQTMSLDDLAAVINTAAGASGVTAQVTAAGALRLTAAGGLEMSFSDDSSGALAALGINTLFTGRNAADIAVNERIASNVQLLAAGLGHVEGSNGTALAIANLQDKALDELSGRSLRGFWQQAVNEISSKAATANDTVESATLVRESISAQMQAVSGVSLDEEAINLLTFQRQFQAAARFVSVIDETLQTLLAMV